MMIRVIVMATEETRAKKFGLRLGVIANPDDTIEVNAVPRVGDSVEVPTEWPAPLIVKSVIWTPFSVGIDAVVILEDKI